MAGYFAVLLVGSGYRSAAVWLLFFLSSEVLRVVECVVDGQEEGGAVLMISSPRSIQKKASLPFRPTYCASAGLYFVLPYDPDSRIAPCLQLNTQAKTTAR
ncbi:hypothetical protein F5H01DRAFT_349638 [Linnemannia elongata]|nr:hypothetical protein F5H01DRAFT_349638 [Linnemannia elongata]